MYIKCMARQTNIFLSFWRLFSRQNRKKDKTWKARGDSVVRRWLKQSLILTQSLFIAEL